MAVNEIVDLIAAKSRAQARFIYRSALLAGIASINPAAFPRSVSDAFPALFGNKKKSGGDWKEFKEYMKRYQKQHNMKLTKGKDCKH